MSRLEYDEVQTYEDIRPVVTFSKCSYCKEQHVKDQVGITSVRYNAWFCSGGCACLYNHDNKLVNYTPETVAVLITMKKRFYGSKKSFIKRESKRNITEM